MKQQSEHVSPLDEEKQTAPSQILIGSDYLDSEFFAKKLLSLLSHEKKIYVDENDPLFPEARKECEKNNMRLLSQAMVAASGVEVTGVNTSKKMHHYIRDHVFHMCIESHDLSILLFHAHYSEEAHNMAQVIKNQTGKRPQLVEMSIEVAGGDMLFIKNHLIIGNSLYYTRSGKDNSEEAARVAVDLLSAKLSNLFAQKGLQFEGISILKPHAACSRFAYHLDLIIFSPNNQSIVLMNKNLFDSASFSDFMRSAERVGIKILALHYDPMPETMKKVGMFVRAADRLNVSGNGSLHQDIAVFAYLILTDKRAVNFLDEKQALIKQRIKQYGLEDLEVRGAVKLFEGIKQFLQSERHMIDRFALLSLVAEAIVNYQNVDAFQLGVNTNFLIIGKTIFHWNLLADFKQVLKKTLPDFTFIDFNHIDDQADLFDPKFALKVSDHLNKKLHCPKAKVSNLCDQSHDLFSPRLHRAIKKNATNIAEKNLFRKLMAVVDPRDDRQVLIAESGIHCATIGPFLDTRPLYQNRMAATEHLANGRYPDALAHYKLALAFAVKNFSPTSRNLAICYCDLLNTLTQAKKKAVIEGFAGEEPASYAALAKQADPSWYKPYLLLVQGCDLEPTMQQELLAEAKKRVKTAHEKATILLMEKGMNTLKAPVLKPNDLPAECQTILESVFL